MPVPPTPAPAAMKADRTDHLTRAAVLALAAAMAVVLAARPAPLSGPEGRRPAAGGVKGTDAEAASLERYLGHWPAAPGDGERIAAFLAEEPGNSRAHFSLGELAWGGGDLGAAAGSFRSALDLDRGYIDRRSPLYQGDRLLRFADDALRVYLREKELHPDDERVRNVIKDLYFIKRSLAGGCD